MKKIQNTFTTLALAIVVLLASVVVPTSAAVNSSGNGMRVSPVKDDTLVIQPGTSKTISVYITNVTDVKTTYRVVANDFVASSDETGAPALLLNGESNDKHGLKDYMSTVDTVTVEPRKQAEVKVTITIPKDAAGGGYYGAVRFAPGSLEQDNNIALSGSVASLILVRVPGDVIEKLSLVSFDARTDGEQKAVFISDKNIEAAIRFRNEGNVQQQPFGKVVLKKGGKTLATYSVNDNQVPGPGNILPDSVRKFSVDLKDVKGFGKYSLEGNFGYGSDGQLLAAKTTFYVVPLWLIGLAIATFLALVAVGVYAKRKMSGSRRRR